MKLLNVSYNILGSNINSSRFRVCVFTISTVDHKYYSHMILPTSTRYNYCKTQTYFTLFSILYYDSRMMRMNLILTNRRRIINDETIEKIEAVQILVAMYVLRL